MGFGDGLGIPPLYDSLALVAYRSCGYCPTITFTWCYPRLSGRSLRRRWAPEPLAIHPPTSQPLEDNWADQDDEPDPKREESRPESTGVLSALPAFPIAPGSQIVAAASPKNELSLWDVEKGRAIGSLRACHDVRRIAFSPDGKLLAAAGGIFRGTVTLWDLTTGSKRIVFEGHRGGVTSLVFAPDGQTLATAGKDKKVRIWSVSALLKMGQLRLGGRSG
jgi:WD40 repeat protein